MLSYYRDHGRYGPLSTALAAEGGVPPTQQVVWSAYGRHANLAKS